MDDNIESTAGADYTDRLRDRPGAAWKRFVPDPYRHNIRKLRLGRVLDIGCGIGRCLAFNDGNGVGLDHNATSVALCRERGLEAYTPDEFAERDRGIFDSLLVSHVLEHLDEDSGFELLARYLPLLAPDGRVVIITPQEAGQRSDPTHVRLVGPVEASRLLARLGLDAQSDRSFPFPRPVGRVFAYNETIVTAVLRG
ncbi:unannotated protein [freshwater metagenome]|uniref:Unannotated protein n=1 Tax=freshwater metagenome TaxID=449393 RepID=A0A6J6JHQ9_9ZZZZ